jgi:hypothetical protein
VGISRDYPLKTRTSKQPIGEIPGYEIIPSHPLKYPRSKQGLMISAKLLHHLLKEKSGSSCHTIDRGRGPFEFLAKRYASTLAFLGLWKNRTATKFRQMVVHSSYIVAVGPREFPPFCITSIMSRQSELTSILVHPICLAKIKPSRRAHNSVVDASQTGIPRQLAARK